MANANGEGSIYKRMRDGKQAGYIGAISFTDESGSQAPHGVRQDVPPSGGQDEGRPRSAR